MFGSKEIANRVYSILIRSFPAYRVGGCVVARPPVARIFLLLARVLVYVYAWELHRTFCNSTPCTQAHGFLPSWQLQQGNNANNDCRLIVE